MISCQNVFLSFSDTPVFDNLNFLIEKGENICFKGTSGKGKSTLLKMLQAYVIPDKGLIKVDGITLNVSTVRQIRESMAWIPQNINLTVQNGFELVKHLGKTSGVPVIEGFLSDLGLESDILYQDFSKISGGQKQRIIIAICLSLNREIVLMDEPTSSLDNASIDLLINTIRSLKGKTIVSASHNQVWLESVDKIIEL